MKRAISLLLALVVACGLSTVGFAASDVPGALTPSPRISIVDDGKGGSNYKIDAGDLFLANTKDQEIVGFDTTLTPGETYKLDVYLAQKSTADAEKVSDILGDDARLLTKADIGTGTVKFRLEKGRGSSAIQTAKVKTKGSGVNTTYYVEIITRDVYGTKMNEVEYELSTTVAGKDRLLETAPKPKNLTFKVGFPTMDDDMLDVGEEGTVIIYNTAPVITKDQFTELAKNTNYKNLYIEGEEGKWTFKGKVAGMKDTNFYYDFDPDTDLLNKFPDQEFMFLNFRGGVNFPTNGEMRIDVSDISDVYDTMYPYLYRDGKLTMINGTHDAGTDQLVFRTNYLGKFIVTNKRITDTSMLPDEPVPEEDAPPIVDLPAPPATNNPATGMPMDLTAVFGLISLAAASLVSRKRK